MHFYKQNFKVSTIKSAGVIKYVLLFLILPLSLISINSFGQNSSDFSGKWILDSKRSSSVYSGMTSVMVLSQTGDIINIEITQIQGDSEPSNTSEKYTIGTSIKEKNKILTTSWSDDKQSFTIREVKGGAENYKVYSLEEFGKILQVESFETLPAGFISQTIMVYNKSL